MSAPEKKTYRGNCHCGQFVFELVQPSEITSCMECNCSICVKKGYSWVFLTPESELTFVKGDESDLTDYSFGSKKMSHKFCPTCGTSVYAVSPGMGRALNGRAIQGFDIWDLTSDQLYDGASMGAKYEPPAFEGPEPTAEIEGNTKIYHGSCHCGAVTYAIKTKPLDETFDKLVVDCNCSSCRRSGATWIYPTGAAVSLTGEENLATYLYGPKNWGTSFCKHCGVNVIRGVNLKSDEEYATMDPMTAKFIQAHKDARPINVKTLNDFSLKDSGLKVLQNDGWTRLQPQYLNP